MAVAVKNPTPVGSARPFDRLPVVSLLGVAYVVGCLVIVFRLLPLGWWHLWASMGASTASYAGAVLLGMLMLAATVGFCVLGGRLLGPDAPAGARSGILFGLIGLLLAVLVTRWGSLWAEYFADNNFFGASSETVGITLTAIIGALSLLSVLGYLFNFDLDKLVGTSANQERSPKQRVLIGCFSAAVAGLVGFLFVRYGPGFDSAIQKLFYQFVSVTLILVALAVALVVYSAPAAHRHMIEFEAQGWLTAKAYKPLQGVRVRRGTLIGLLIIAGTGIYSMLNHNVLPAGDWQLNVPFTGKVTLEGDGDVGPELDARFPDRPRGPGAPPLVIDRRTLQQINEKADPRKFVKVVTTTVSTLTNLKNGQVYPIEEYKAEIRRLKEENPDFKNEDPEKILPTVPPTPAYGTEQYVTLTLLPNVRYTLGLLLLPLVAIWLAWRTVNLPSFADFQIATEAEMNKVSWTTKKRLYQDTIVVLITVFMMAVYLFAIDQIWSRTAELAAGGGDRAQARRLGDEQEG